MQGTLQMHWEELSLHENNIRNDGASAIADALKINTTLYKNYPCTRTISEMRVQWPFHGHLNPNRHYNNCGSPTTTLFDLIL